MKDKIITLSSQGEEIWVPGKDCLIFIDSKERTRDIETVQLLEGGMNIRYDKGNQTYHYYNNRINLLQNSTKIVLSSDQLIYKNKLPLSDVKEKNFSIKKVISLITIWNILKLMSRNL
jgi:hypothetical protein